MILSKIIFIYAVLLTIVVVVLICCIKGLIKELNADNEEPGEINSNFQSLNECTDYYNLELTKANTIYKANHLEKKEYKWLKRYLWRQYKANLNVVNKINKAVRKNEINNLKSGPTTTSYEEDPVEEDPVESSVEDVEALPPTNPIQIEDKKGETNVEETTN